MLIFRLILAVVACAPLFAETIQDENPCQCFCKYTKRYWNFVINDEPELATYVGYSTHNDRWTDYSLGAIKNRHDFIRTLLSEVEVLDPNSYDQDDQVDLVLLKKQLQDEVEGMQFPSEYLLVDQLNSVFNDIQQIYALMPTESVQDYDNLISRLEAVPTLIDQTIALLDAGLKQGITPPQITLRDLPGQIEKVLQDGQSKGVLYEPFTKFPYTISHADQVNLVMKAQGALGQHVLPAYRKLHNYLVTTYIPGCRTSIGWSDLPNGAAWYAYLVRTETTTDLTPQQIHDIGLAEVGRINKQMEAIHSEVGFLGPFKAFRNYLNTSSEFFFRSEEELLQAYRDVMAKAYEALPLLFGKVSTQPCEIKSIPKYAGISGPAAYYIAGSPLTGRPGGFFVNTNNLQGNPRWGIEPLVLHEGVPGHHLQTSVAHELQDMADFRRYARYTAYDEGWGLYSEGLGYEMGLYRDPYSRYGRLNLEMLRAARLVVDTGIHAMGWTRQQAIDYMALQLGKCDQEIINEVDRYIVQPGQALAYKIGELKLIELRKRAQQALGDNFDIREFHDQILGRGALPLDVLEGFINEWINSKSG